METDRQTGELDRTRQTRTVRGPRKGPQSRRVLAADTRRKPSELTQRQRLVQAMIELSAKSGYQEVSIAELCAGAGVSTVTFYEEFADKEEALVSAYRACAEGIFGPMRSVLMERETAEIPRIALGAMLDAIAEDPDAGRIVFVEALGAGERMLQERTRAFERFEKRVQEYIGRLPSDSVTLDIPVGAVAGALRHIIARHLRNHAEDQLPARIDDGLAWLNSYLRAAARDPWSTSAAALLKLPPVELPARARRLERLPRGQHGLPASLVARSQRTRLINAIAEVTMRKGYADANINEIVASARVAKPVFYKFFSDKQHAFLEAQQYPTQHILDRCAEAYYSAREWPERMWKLLDALTELITANPAISHLRLVECYAAGPEAIRRAEQITHSFTIFLEEGYHQSTKAQQLPRLVSQAITGAIFEIIRRQIAQRRPHALKEHLPQLTYIATAPFIGPEQSIAILQQNTTRQGT